MFHKFKYCPLYMHIIQHPDLWSVAWCWWYSHIGIMMMYCAVYITWKWHCLISKIIILWTLYPIHPSHPFSSSQAIGKEELSIKQHTLYYMYENIIFYLIYELVKLFVFAFCVHLNVNMLKSFSFLIIVI